MKNEILENEVKQLSEQLHKVKRKEEQAEIMMEEWKNKCIRVEEEL